MNNLCRSLKSGFCQVFGKLKLDDYLESSGERTRHLRSGWCVVMTSSVLLNAYGLHIHLERDSQSLPLNNWWEHPRRAIELPCRGPNSHLCVLAETWPWFSQDGAGLWGAEAFPWKERKAPRAAVWAERVEVWAEPVEVWAEPVEPAGLSASRRNRRVPAAKRLHLSVSPSPICKTG